MEALHGKNNSAEAKFLKVLAIAVGHSNTTGIKFFKDLPEDCLLVMFINFAKKQMYCSLFASKLKTWFNEFGKDETKLKVRFRVKESRAYLSKFPDLIQMVYGQIKGKKPRENLVRIHHQSILLRKVVSLILRTTSFNDVLLE